MNRPILVAYATKRGSTKEVAESVAEQLAAGGLAVEVRDAGAVDDLAPYGAVVLGSALYMGRMHKDARTFLAAHRTALQAMPLAVFGMGPRTLADHDVRESRKQIQSSLARAGGIAPFSVAVFGGVVDPAKLGFPFSRLEASDVRDWEAIAAWTAGIAPRLASREPEAAATLARAGAA